MTVSNSNNRDRLTANGVLVDFDFTFKIFSSADIQVYIIDTDGVATLQTLTTHYTVAIDSTSDGGTVTFLTAPTDTYEVLMIRNISYVQSADIPVNGGFSEEVIENALDKLAMQIQQLEDRLDRAVSFPLTGTITDIALPTPEDGKALIWDGTDGDIENSTVDVADFDAALTAAQAAQAAAEAAQTAAETAETNAETAETNAETAQALAEAAVNDINAEIHDTDDDTGVEVERGADDDTIRMKVASTDEMDITASGMKLKNGARVNDINDEDDMSSDSATALATQQSIKAYADGLFNSILTKTEVIDSNGNWTAPTGVNQVEYTLVGGGGGGGAGNNTASTGSGAGGGGGETIRGIMEVTPEATHAVTIGAAGAAGTSEGDGGAGGNSTFAGANYTVTATGGSGGDGYGGAGYTGGAGASGNTDLDGKDYNDGGDPGGGGEHYSYAGGSGGAANASAQQGSGGGSSLVGRGGDGGGNGVDGDDGQGPGAGGGGGGNNGGSGGAGAKGILILKYNVNGAPS